MGHLAALLSRTGEDVSESLRRMLKLATLRAGDSYGFASKEGVIISPSLEDGIPESPAMMGHRLEKVTQYDVPQPLIQYGVPMIFEGRLWGSATCLNMVKASERVGPDIHQGITRLVRDTPGSFVVVSLDGDRLLCGRDPVGIVPVYIGESTDLIGLASSRKMLWEAGLNTVSLPPGHLAEMSPSGVKIESITTLHKPTTRRLSMDEALERLDHLIYQAVECQSMGVFKASLGFSGGIDSTILAHYLNRTGVEMDLVCVGLEGSYDLSVAETAADWLDLPITLESKTIADVQRDLDQVLWTVEEPNPMRIGIALPFNWASRSACESGHTIFFSGNGSDELFAGYHKYLRQYSISEEVVGDEIYKDITRSYRVNFERDYKICSENGLELRLPFADKELIEYGLSIPIELKISPSKQPRRKLILRELARRLGLPDDLSSRKKKAIQYSTGVNKALKKLARREGKSLNSYLTDRLENLKKLNLRL